MAGPLNPKVGEYYNMLSDRSDQWVYVFAEEGPYVYLSGIEDTYSHQKVRKSAVRNVVRTDEWWSNGLQMINGDILGLAGKSYSEGILFLNGDEDES